MFHKILMSVLAIAISVAQVQASTQSGLKAAFDELNYSLTVEWDQKDQAVYSKEMEKFNQTLQSLRSQGLTNQEILSFVKSEVKSAQFSQSLDQVLAQLNANIIDQAEAMKMISESLKGTYQKGASWSTLDNQIVVWGIIIAIIGGFVVFCKINSCSVDLSGLGQNPNDPYWDGYDQGYNDGYYDGSYYY